MKKKIKKSYLFIGTGFILLLVSVLMLFLNKSPEQRRKTNQNIDFDLSVSDNGKKIYKNKLDAYKAEEQDSLERLRKEQNVSLDNLEILNDTTVLQDDEKDTELEELENLAQEKKSKNTTINKKTKQYKKNYEKKIKFTYENTKSKINNIESSERERKKDNADDWLKENSDLNDNIKIYETEETPKKFLALKLKIYGDQVISRKNNRVKMLLTVPAKIKNRLISKNTIVYGFASFGKNRLLIKVNQIKGIPVNLIVYDANDNYPGIYISAENLSDDIKDDVLAENVNGLNTGLNLLELGKRLFNKKRKELKIYLINNYRIILKEKQ